MIINRTCGGLSSTRRFLALSLSADQRAVGPGSAVPAGNYRRYRMAVDRCPFTGRVQ